MKVKTVVYVCLYFCLGFEKSKHLYSIVLEARKAQVHRCELGLLGLDWSNQNFCFVYSALFIQSCSFSLLGPGCSPVCNRKDVWKLTGKLGIVGDDSTVDVVIRQRVHQSLQTDIRIECVKPFIDEQGAQ